MDKLDAIIVQQHADELAGEVDALTVTIAFQPDGQGTKLIIGTRGLPDNESTMALLKRTIELIQTGRVPTAEVVFSRT